MRRRLRRRRADLPRRRRGCCGSPRRRDARAAAARRLPAGEPRLGADVRDRRRVPLMLALPGLSFTDAFFEAMSGLTHHRRDGAHRPRYAAAVDQPVAPRAALARRHGHHRAGGGDPAAARRRRHADVPGRDARPGEGREADAAHHRDGQGAVVRLRRDHRGLHRLAAVRGHELVRCDLPRVLDDVARRLLDARRQHRLLRLAGHRAGADRLHADRGDELRRALRRAGADEPARVRDRRRGEGDAA